MKKITADFATLTATLCTVFEGLDLEQIMDFVGYATRKDARHPFATKGHAYQMHRNVYDMGYDTADYIITKVFEDNGDIMVTFLERTGEGYNCPEEITEWTFEKSDFMIDVVGIDLDTYWGEG